MNRPRGARPVGNLYQFGCVRLSIHRSPRSRAPYPTDPPRIRRESQHDPSEQRGSAGCGSVRMFFENFPRETRATLERQSPNEIPRDALFASPREGHPLNLEAERGCHQPASAAGGLTASASASGPGPARLKSAVSHQSAGDRAGCLVAAGHHRVGCQVGWPVCYPLPLAGASREARPYAMCCAGSAGWGNDPPDRKGVASPVPLPMALGGPWENTTGRILRPE